MLLFLGSGCWRAAPLKAQTVTDALPQFNRAGSHPAGWWPMDGAAPRSAYAGPRACASCHATEYAEWQTSQMAHAMKPCAESKLIQTNPHMTYRHGPYTYRVELESGRCIYSVTDGNQTLSAPLLWAYGDNVVGETFVLQIGGVYYETEVAYYPVLHRLDVVAGLDRAVPPSIRQAFALPLDPSTARQCILCHTTAAVTENQLHADALMPGVTCEDCHGPGTAHVAEMRQPRNLRRRRAVLIFNPGRLSPARAEQFCGACHRTSRLVVAEGLHGLDTVHYEPYRLEMSQCWIISQRITCLTCHNPHQPLERNAAAYDATCLACHSASGSTAGVQTKACPVATRNCVTCHMPKCLLPRSPFTMSDHFIRVVGPGDPCAKS